jgi:hypothetical protein
MMNADGSERRQLSDIATGIDSLDWQALGDRNLATNPDLEADPSPWYYTHTTGSAAFSWASDEARSPSHALKIVASGPSNALSRWMTRIGALPVRPGATYQVSAWVKANAITMGYGSVDVTFWDRNRQYLPGSAVSSSQTGQTIRGVQDWTRIAFRITAPPQAASVRLEFRVAGVGTVWVDDLDVRHAALVAATAG